MTITEIRRDKRAQVRLMLDGTEGPLLHARTVAESPYGVGRELSEAELSSLIAQSAYDRAHDRALYLLGMRDYARRELVRKLTEEAPPEVAEAVADRLTAVGLLNDEAYAERRAQSLSRGKHLPRRRVAQELMRRGIDRDTAQNAAEELEIDDFQQALALLRKKYYNKLRDRDDRRKTAAALARRGFSYDAIRHALALWDEENGAPADTDGADEPNDAGDVDEWQ